MENQIISVEAQRKIEESTAIAKKYENFSITTSEIYAVSGEDLKIVKAKKKEVDELRKSLTKPLDESKKRIMGLFKPPLDVLATAEYAISNAMLKWQREQEAIRKAEENRILELQQKEAARLQKLADNAKKRGDDKKVEEFQGRAAVVQTTQPVVAPKVADITGLRNRTNWKFRIVDIEKIPRQYMIPNEVMIGQIARSTKGSLKVEGIEFYPEESLSGSR